MLINASLVEAQEIPPNSISTAHRIDIEGNYSYQRYIENDAVLSRIPFRKIRHGYGLALHYTNSLSKRVLLETGLMLLSDTHVLDSVALFCGPSNCTYGFSKIAFKNIGLPIQLGLHSSLRQRVVFSANAGVLLTNRLFFESRNFYYDGVKYSEGGGSWGISDFQLHLNIKCALTYRINDLPISLIYRYLRPLNSLDKPYIAFVRHTIGIGVGIWSK